ncbi:type II secretion system protein GspG [Neisseria elongata]
MYDEMRRQLAVNTLSTLVSEVEFYRLQHGVYPESLEQLQESQPNKPIFIYDTSSTPLSSEPFRLFYYERSGDAHYYLRSVGNDGEPFTGDDILPDIGQSKNGKIGLLMQKGTH